jgi:hypothetical protein
MPKKSKKVKEDSPEDLASAIIYIIYKSSLTDKRQIIVDLMNENPELFVYVYEMLTDTQREIILDKV